MYVNIVVYVSVRVKSSTCEVTNSNKLCKFWDMNESSMTKIYVISGITSHATKR